MSSENFKPSNFKGWEPAVNTTPLSQYASAKILAAHRDRLSSQTISGLFASDPRRAETYLISAAGLELDFSKNAIDQPLLKTLAAMAGEAGVAEKRTAMVAGEKINSSENRAVFHTALRDFTNSDPQVDGESIKPGIEDVLQKIRILTSNIHGGKWTGYSGKKIRHIINIGVGGSFLGIKAVLDGLQPWQRDDITTHYIANIDPTELHQVLTNIDAETALFIVASKSFSTLETKLNATAARSWMLEQGVPEQDIHRHFVAISSNISAATAFGIAKDNIFPMGDWVGGRYSLWSAIGLMIPLATSYAVFERLLKGAGAMDQHFLTAPFTENMPVVMALLGIWHQNWLGAESHAVIPYDSRLTTFPKHLQQMDMESNGKTVTRDGEAVHYHTGAVIWGDVGTNGQHAYHQLFHQGSRLVPIDFIVPLQSCNPIGAQHRWLVAHAFAQSQALMQGKNLEQARAELANKGLNESQLESLARQKVIPGNRPSNMLTMDRLTPENLGALVALYEHKVFVQGIIWNLNSFDQWGVELGKVLGNKIFDCLSEDAFSDVEDSSTNRLIKKFKLLND
ncbi:glucose-6-phosphate isomerase [Pelagibaculum spongiae]|uniref:Glucose-6-phosphate isomerase n=1 Tax=Pelagibaculum spongiae TaxID=2080658 RepID=A0A2V1GY08_9GAMM|nr:glucose-6-phosphate isomerase [Pelagibaculum spongiae]PVZ70217.1 glucose-6-phosphate isomerase [Pelagibaculum spongiae]